MDADVNTPLVERELLEESRRIWDTNAHAWDAHIGQGGGWQSVLIAPVVERLLDLHPGETVLDVACGNGIFSRRMAELGVHVVASDFSTRLIELARERTSGHPSADRLEYYVVDATDEAQLLALGRVGGPDGVERRFDAAVCNMALMDMPEIEPLFRALVRLLKPGGRFVFSIMHPCFNGDSVSMIVERNDYAEEPIYAIKVSRYLSAGVTTGLAIRQQPAEQYYWHRPLSVLLGAGFAAGFVADALEEPRIAPQTPPTDRLDWANFDMPPVLFVRMRLPNA